MHRNSHLCYSGQAGSDASCMHASSCSTLQLLASVGAVVAKALPDQALCRLSYRRLCWNEDHHGLYKRVLDHHQCVYKSHSSHDSITSAVLLTWQQLSAFAQVTCQLQCCTVRVRRTPRVAAELHIIHDSSVTSIGVASLVAWRRPAWFS